MKEKKDYTIITKAICYNSYVRKYIVNNIPKIHNDLRIHLLDEGYRLLKLLYLSGYNKGNIRMKYLVELKVNISLLDTLTSSIRELDCVSNKYLNTSVGMLTDIKNIVYGWILNEEARKN